MDAIYEASSLKPHFVPLQIIVEFLSQLIFFNLIYKLYIEIISI